MIGALGFDKRAAVKPLRALDERGNNEARQAFAIAHNGVGGFLAEVVHQINAEIDAAQLLEQGV